MSLVLCCNKVTDMSDNLWPVTLRHAVYLRNRAPSAALGGRTTLQVLGAPIDSVNKLFTVHSRSESRSGWTMPADVLWSPKHGLGSILATTTYPTRSVLVKNQTRFDIVDLSVHVQVGTRARARDACCFGG